MRATTLSERRNTPTPSRHLSSRVAREGELNSRWLRSATLVVPTLRTWMVGLALFSVVTITLVRYIHEYLAPLEPVQGASVLVIEAWVGANLIDFVDPLVRSGRYSRYIAVGTPLDPLSDLARLGTSGDVWKVRLIELGIPPKSIEVVRVPRMNRHRTAHAALALARHLSDHPVAAVDLISASTHGRRSSMLYQQALAPVAVGIYSAPLDYDEAHWWRSSAGVRSVIGEALALGYAVLISNEVQRAREQWDELPREMKVVAGVPGD